MKSAAPLVLLTALAAIPSASAGEMQQPTVVTPANVGDAIARVQAIADDTVRLHAIEQIAHVLGDDSSHVVERDILTLAALMSDRSDNVRHDAAIALGEIGPRAIAAAPALQAALPAVDCVWASHNSRPAIIFALRRIGVEPVLADCPPADLSPPPPSVSRSPRGG